MSLKATIESLLFISIRPLTVQKLTELTGRDAKEISATLDDLVSSYNTDERGVHIQKNGTKYQMVTAGQASAAVQQFLKEETTGDLTQPQLETLTVIAYRGPITKTELELIRGVNCSLILRNLLMRGLIEEKEDRQKMIQVYSVSFEFMRFLGITDSTQLPDYQRLNADPNLQHLISEKPETTTPEPTGSQVTPA